MLRFIIRRLIHGAGVLLGVLTIVFFLFTVLPGDPSRMIMGQRADMASVEAVKAELGLNEPLWKQYLLYISDVLPVTVMNHSDTSSVFYYDKFKYPRTTILVNSGNHSLVIKPPFLRKSFQSRRPVGEIIAEAFPNTAILALTSITLALLIGLVAGVYAALHKNSFSDRFLVVITSLGMSTPSFLAAVIIAWLFAFVLADYTHLNMTGSLYAVDDFGRGEYLELKNLILPALTLGIRPLGLITALTRNSMIEVLSQDYIRAAYAKGLPGRIVVLKHALPNAVNPVITAASGWLASLLAGAVFVEYIFGWKGIGLVVVEALDKYDLPVLMGCVIFISVMLVLMNLITDLIYGWLDPRTRKY